MSERQAHQARRMRGQQGTALVVALLVVALVSTMVSALATRLNLDIHRTGNLTAAEQAYEMAIGVEAWALGAIEADAQSSQTDHPGENWALPLPPTESDGGEVAGQLVDLNGRFNLNSLLDERGAIRESSRQTLARLLKVLDLQNDPLGAMLDWVDKDTDVRFPSGAEDLEYLSQDPSYRAANQPFSDVSELLLIRGIDDEFYAQLAPFVSALPSDAPFNVNTASAETLQAWVPGLSATEAELLVEARGDLGFESKEAFLAHPSVTGRTGIDIDGIHVSSRHFLVEAWVELGPARVHLQSLLERNEDGEAGVMSRNLGGTYPMPVQETTGALDG